MKKVPREVEPEEAEKKDPKGPKCYECSGFGHIRADCENLKQSKGKANNATLSDESEEEEAPEQEKFLTFVFHMSKKKILTQSIVMMGKNSRRPIKPSI
jgi:hypothetical protein